MYRRDLRLTIHRAQRYQINDDRWLVITGQISGLSESSVSRTREPGIEHQSSFHFDREVNNLERGNCSFRE